MHDVGMNMSQLAMSVKQVDDTIELAHEWSHQLLHATENFDMERIGAKLEAAMTALHEAHDALEGYEEAIEAEPQLRRLREAGCKVAEHEQRRAGTSTSIRTGRTVTRAAIVVAPAPSWSVFRLPHPTTCCAVLTSRSRAAATWPTDPRPCAT